MKMSPFFAKISLILFVVLICCLLGIIVSNIYSIKDNWEHGAIQPHGLLRQHGDYWVWHNYIRSQVDYNGNESITLTTHATYMDLALLPNLLERWMAPISLAIYVSGSDFDNTIESLGYLNACAKQGYLMSRYVSIHLVFHNLHIPENLHVFGISFTVAPNKCLMPPIYEEGQQELTYWYKQKLKYPVNLLRNVARSNAQTYYIMALDIQLLPSPNFVKKFLKYTWRRHWKHDDITKPYSTVFCLPTFAHKWNAPLPKTKNELILILDDFNITNPIYDDYKMQKEWLITPSHKDVLKVFMSSNKMDMCVAYVSINELEPLYDERCDMESIYERGSNLKGRLLTGLNYTFLTLDGAFLIRRTLDSWNHIKLNGTSTKASLPLLMAWYQFYNDLVNLGPLETMYKWDQWLMYRPLV